MIRTLQAGRALAAIAVVFTHINDGLPPFGFDLPSWIANPSSFGGRGVDFFFVLSGFIIVYAHAGDSRDVASAKTYTFKRISRIFIPYLPIALFLMAAYTALPQLSESDREWSWASSIFLLPSQDGPVLSVAWTLIHELAFYSVFIAFYFFRRFRFLIAAWAIAIIALWSLGIDTGGRSSLFNAYLAPINLEFIGGMLAAWYYRRIPAGFAWPLVLIGLFGAVMYFTFHSELHRVVFGACIVPMVIGFVLLEGRGLRVPEWLVFLGSASYAIYLIHKPLISVLVRLSDYGGSWEIAFAVSLIGSVIAGSLYHVGFEKPVLRWARSKRIRRATASA